MSLFKTQIPIDLESVKKLLPKDHNVEAVRYDPVNQQLEMFWHSSVLVTPFTFHTDFSVADLQAKRLPANTKVVERGTPLNVPKMLNDQVQANKALNFDQRAQKAVQKAARAAARAARQKKTVDTTSPVDRQGVSTE